MSSPTEDPQRPQGKPYASEQMARLAGALSDLDHPKVIGRYHILEPVGEGGMGTVYKAEQRRPIERTVAVKVVKLGMDTREVIARFEAERQALALMDHPNVARVIDAGMTDQGRPYFVMEFVGGEPITSYCDRHKLTVEQRLRLFMQACEAVQHAHQKAIIHRDLKPSNILVTEHQDKPWIKVIDFGLAKAIDRRLTEKTLFTETGQFIGTLEYMSPEQADGRGNDVDTRTDVYSLGVVLYELLTGTVPFEAAKLRTAGYQEIQRIIREDEPPRPSTRISKLGDSAIAVAESRKLAVDELERQLHRELDWIPLRAMRKERAQRYSTPTELAADIENYLENRPLLAGPESTGYKLKKFLRRNRTGVAVAGAFVLLLIAGIVATTWQAVRISRALDQVQRQKRQTDLANNSLSAVNLFLTRDVLGSSEPSVTRGKELTVVEALNNASQRIKTFGNDPGTEVDVRMTIAEAYGTLAHPELGLPHARTALEICRRSFPNDPALIHALYHVSSLLRHQGELKEAESLATEAIDRATRQLGETDDMTLESISLLADIRRLQGRLDEAETLATRVLDLRIRVDGEQGRETLNAIQLLADVKSARGKEAEVEELLQKAIAVSDKINGHDHPDHIQLMISYASCLRQQTKLDEAEAVLRDAVAQARRVLGDDHWDTFSAVNNLAETLFVQGKLEETEPLFREALDKCRRLRGSDHETTQGIVNNYARLLDRMGKWDQAEPLYREAYETGKRVRGADHPNVLISTLNYARALSSHEQYEQAESLDRAAMPLAKQKLGEDHPVTLAFSQNLGEVLHKQGRQAEAESVLREGLEHRKTVFGESNQETVGSMRALASFLFDENRIEEAAPLAQRVYELTPTVRTDPRNRAQNMMLWPQCLMRQGKFEPAYAPLVEVEHGLSAAGMIKSYLLRDDLMMLITVCDKTDRSAEAQKYRARLAEAIAATQPVTAPASNPSR